MRPRADPEPTLQTPPPALIFTLSLVSFLGSNVPPISHLRASCFRSLRQIILPRRFQRRSRGLPLPSCSFLPARLLLSCSLPSSGPGIYEPSSRAARFLCTLPSSGPGIYEPSSRAARFENCGCGECWGGDGGGGECSGSGGDDGCDLSPLLLLPRLLFPCSSPLLRLLFPR